MWATYFIWIILYCVPCGPYIIYLYLYIIIIYIIIISFLIQLYSLLKIQVVFFYVLYLLFHFKTMLSSPWVVIAVTRVKLLPTTMICIL
jgi:hypothetical protein